MFIKNNFVKLFIVVACLSLVSCSLFGPARVESTAKSQKIEVDDPVKYEAAQKQLKIANQHFARKNYAQALKFSNESLATYETWDGYYLKAAVLYHTGKTQDAIDNFQNARRINPDNEQLLLSTATAYTTAGDLNEALQIYQRLQTINPDEPIYAFKTGTTYKNLRQYDLAYTELKKTEKPKFRYLDQTYLHLGDVCLELKKYDESRDYFKKAQELNPKLKDANLGAKSTELVREIDAGNAAFKKNDFELARKHYQKARTMEPKSPAPYLLLGSLELALNNSKAAQEVLQQAVEMDPKNPGAYSLLGSAHHLAGDYKKALHVLDLGLAIAPENFEMYNKKGLVYNSRNESPAAISAFYKALQIQPDYLKARYNLALTLLNEKRYSDARKEFGIAAKQAPENEEYKKGARLVDMFEHLDRGDRFFENRKFPAALSAYTKAKEVFNDKPVVYNSFGKVEFEQKQYKPAIASYNRSLELDPKNIPALQGQLRVYSRLRDKKQVDVLVKRIQDLTKNDITAALSLGRIKEDEGQLEEAKKYYLDLLKARPEEELIKRRLGYVYYKQGLEFNDKERFKPALESFEKAQEYNDQIPQLPQTIQIVNENIKYANFLPKLKTAERLFDQARYKEALPLLESVYTKLKRPMILVRISNCYIALGQEQKGIEILENAKGTGSEELPILEAMYTHLLNKGKMDEAQKGFREIVAVHKQAHFSWYKLGVIDLLKKKYGTALENFSLALLHKPDFAIAHIARGVVYYEQAKKDQAKAEFQAAMDNESSQNLANFNMAILFFNDGLVDKAETILRDLIKIEPTDNDARYQLSYIYFEKGQLDLAKEQLDDAIKNRKEARLYFGLARIKEKNYLAQKSADNANQLQTAYKELIANYPETRFAEESRAKLQQINPDSRVLQPYPEFNSEIRQALVYNGDLLYLSGRELSSLKSSTKKKNWSIAFSQKPVSMIADRFGHVFFGNELQIIDLSNGNVLKTIPLKKDAYKMIGAYNQIGIISDKKAPVLTVYDQFGVVLAESGALAHSRYFYFKDQFYQLLPTNKQLAVSLLTADLKVAKNIQLNFNRLNSQPKILTSDKHIYLYIPGSSLFILSASLDDQKATTLPATAIYLFISPKGEILVPAANYLSRYSAAGKYIDKINLDQNMVSRNALWLLSDTFLYMGRDYRIYNLDYAGKQKWSIPVQKLAGIKKNGQVYSLYH